MQHRASCCCGQLTLAFDGEITKTSVCHCYECQKRTGSAFGVQTRVETQRVTIQGESKIFQRRGDSGGVASFHFCPECGATVFWEIDKLPGWTSVALGAFANPDLPSPSVMVYGSRKHHWVVMPETTVEYFG